MPLVVGSGSGITIISKINMIKITRTAKQPSVIISATKRVIQVLLVQLRIKNGKQSNSFTVAGS